MLHFFNYCDFVAFFLEIGLTFSFGWEINFDFQEVALLWISIVGGNDGKIADIIFVIFKLRKPLESVARPVDGVQEEEIVEIWRLLLPNFVLLVDYHFFFLIELYLLVLLPSAI